MRTPLPVCPLVTSPALMNVFLLEVHHSLSLASEMYQALTQAHTELCQLHRARGVTERVTLEQRLLQRALQHWHSLDPPGAYYSSQTQKDVSRVSPSHSRESSISLTLICCTCHLRSSNCKNDIFLIDSPV